MMMMVLRWGVVFCFLFFWIFRQPFFPLSHFSGCVCVCLDPLFSLFEKEYHHIAKSHPRRKKKERGRKRRRKTTKKKEWKKNERWWWWSHKEEEEAKEGNPATLRARSKEVDRVREAYVARCSEERGTSFANARNRRRRREREREREREKRTHPRT